MKLRNISVYENRREYGKNGIGFIFEAFSMTALYEMFLPLIETDNIKKIIIVCGTIYKQKEIADHCEGILEIDVPFDVQKFLTLSDKQKKIQLVEMIHDSLLWVANKYGIDETPFHIAHQKCIEANYKYKVIWKKPKSSPNRQHKAIVEIEVTLYKAILTLRVINQSNETVKKEVIIEEKPNTFLLGRFLGELKWVSNNEVRLLSKHYEEGNLKYFELTI